MIATRKEIKMTSSERVKKSFLHQTPDRTPVFEYYMISEIITKHVLKRPYSYINWDACLREKGWEGAVQQLAVDRLDLAEFFGFDMMYVTCNQPAPCAVTIDNVSSQSNICDDPAENIAIRNRQKKKGDRSLNDERFLIYKLLKKEMSLRGIDLPILAPAYHHGVWTDVDLMQTMILSPDVAKEHFTIATENALAIIEKYSLLGVEIIGIGGDFAGNSPLISPDCYKEFIVPELKIISDKIHKLGHLAVNTSDGNLWNVIDAFLLDSGVDGYLEIDLHAGMELKKLKDAYGDKITFLGNMDCGNTLSFASAAEIEKDTFACIEDGLGNGGHIFTASNAITESVPFENYMAMINAYKKYWDLPLIS
jgi:uroporphyrinogen decarboxylase-like protein